jgi:hypothetical protein
MLSVFSRCGERSKPSTSTRRNESPSAKADLGQSEASLEKTGKEQIGRMVKPKTSANWETLSLPAPHGLVGSGGALVVSSSVI